MVKIKVKAIRVGNSVRVAIPTDVLAASKVAQGDILWVDYDENSKKITLEKCRVP
jgi:antitoxin component of MazEF toxin-antitoxin module